MVSQNHVFISNFTLKFADTRIEAIYCRSNEKCIKRNNIIYTSIFIALSIILDVLLLYFKHLYFNIYLSILSFVTTAITVLCLILTIPISKTLLQYLICYVIYITSFIKFCILRFFFSQVIQADLSLFSLVLGLELLIRITWFQAGCLDFSDGFLCTLVIMILNYALFFWPVPRAIHFRGSVYCFILLVMLTIAYFYVKEKRKNFYLNIVLQNKNEWYNSVLENINSGFVRVDDSNLTYMNQTFRNLFNTIYRYLKSERVSTQNGDDEHGLNTVLSEETVSNESMLAVLLFIFNEITTNENEKITYTGSLNIIEEYSLQNNNFCFLGRASYSLGNGENLTNLHFEVYGRCSKQHHSSSYAYEFIFNDISRVKVIEETKAEVKYKSLFLSKVAHEFKNPILCITELIDQIFDEIQQLNIDNSYLQAVNDLLSQIKSMSDYMIILIKDLDYFSQKQVSSGSCITDVTAVNIKNLISFCKNITIALIKKMQKQLSIDFIVEVGNDLPPYLFVDEVKLKQILINLLSNSVKYTNYGNIKFSVSIDNGAVKFSIKDTGKGISDTQKEKLFKPFSRDFNERSTISAGLGLFIVKELTQLINSNLLYSSKLNEGSEFWFNIEVPKSMDIVDSLKAEEDAKEGLNYDSSNLEVQSFCSEKTIKKEFDPNFIKNLYMLDKEVKVDKCICSNINLEHLRSPNQLNIILVDDEILPRQACLRLIKRFLGNKLISVNILEGNDGVECLALFYNAFKNKVKIDFIITDETMNILNGLDCSAILKKIYNNKAIEPIPLFVLTAYESIKTYEGVKMAFSKPLNETKLQLILDTYHNAINK
jgi:nitrogen-specific signal transduction histidine kinase